MSNATKCDRCGSCYEHGGRSIRQGFGSDMEEFDLCADCAEAFDAWMERGQMADASEGIVMARVFGVDDTREQLEADVRKFAQVFYADNLLVYDKVIELLNRQAAITEREVKLRELHKFEENHRWHVRSIEEVNQQLNERIAELQREIATLKEHRAGNMERLHELADECAELRKYRDEWKGLAEKYRADSIAAQEETERYRAKLGDVLDAIHEAERAVR